jgi:Transglutaminase-like superfamily
MHKYWLTDHAYACVTADHAVVLDLRRDKYVAIPNVNGSCLEDQIEGWPDTAGLPQREVDCAPSERILEQLLKMDLITDDVRRGRQGPALTVPRPQTPIIETTLLHTLLPDAPRPPRIGGKDFVNFVAAYFSARWRLRFHTLEAVVADVQTRKQRCNHAALDLALAAHLVATARRLRPFVYRAYGKCLFDSLVLVEFLARYEAFPDWIFGVQTRPFMAHSWVQSGTTVLNDVPGHASLYTPIMVV